MPFKDRTANLLYSCLSEVINNHMVSLYMSFSPSHKYLEFNVLWCLIEVQFYFLLCNWHHFLYSKKQTHTFFLACVFVFITVLLLQVIFEVNTGATGQYKINRTVFNPALFGDESLFSNCTVMSKAHIQEFE